ncbi:MAG: preprotein translocase subunit SecG [Pseudomonadota bacterium]
MENVILIILLILALALIAIVLMQRSEGGGLGIGGGGGGMSTGRSQATALGKLTWILGAGFMAISLVMTVLSAQNTAGTSVIDQLGVETPGADDAPGLPGLPGDSLLPPTADDTPLLPRADE